jgi:hypothetical protein
VSPRCCKRCGTISTGASTAIPVAALPLLRSRVDLGIAQTTDGGYTDIESELGVVCSDSPNPRVPVLLPVQSQFAQLRSGWSGVKWTWPNEACAQWPAMGAQRYTGPWNVPIPRCST